MKKEFNPFNTVGYISAEYFCDRKDELDRLLINAENGINTTLISARKYGKSALIYRLFEELNENKAWNCIYIDVYATQNLKEFTELVAVNVIKMFPRKQSVVKRFLEYLKVLRPVFSYDYLTGQPEVHFEFAQPSEYEKTLSAIFKFLDDQKSPVLIALDEFQQVSHYPEKNTEAILRTVIQTLKNVQFIFSGSNQHLMVEIFNNAKRPFFSSTQNLSLNEIPVEFYKPFIINHFKSKKRELNDETVDFILNWTLNHTYYTQFVCNQLFSTKILKPDIQFTKTVISKILDAEQATFLQYRNLLTPFQWKLLIAIAKEEQLYQPQSKNFIQKHRLGVASSVVKTLQSLIDKEMVFIKNGKEANYYRVYDVFLLRWLQRTY